MLESLYRHYRFLTAQIEIFEKPIAEHMQSHEERIALLTTIPGVDRLVAWHPVAELETDISVFPAASHCASWAGLVPGCRKGNKFLRRVLAQAAWASSRCKKGKNGSDVRQIEIRSTVLRVTLRRRR
jgi:transposase